MQFHPAPLPHYTSALLPLPHGLFTCAGGVSAPPYQSLNLGLQVGDQAEQVRQNRQRVTEALGLQRLLTLRQVHADRVLVDRAGSDEAEAEAEGYDAVISDRPGTGLLIQQADCQAVLLAAPAHGVVAAIHCGWRGSVLGIIATTITRLEQELGVAPAALTAVISPSLGPCCAEFVNHRQELPSWMEEFMVRPNYFDFWAISRQQLINSGVSGERIETAAICTCCNQQFFSYRRAKRETQGICGRNGSVIGLAA